MNCMYADGEFEERLHRTWLTVLMELGHREVAALVVDAEIIMIRSSFDLEGFYIDVPPSSFPLIQEEPSIKQIIEKTLRLIANGQIFYQNGHRIEYRVKLLDVGGDWRQVVKDLIVNAKDANQGIISEMLAARKGKQALTYNEMKFASQSEIRIAQELERRQVLFFPLPLAVRQETGVPWKDHREVDFLICQEGRWGILEVSHHPDRFEQDAQKDAWFKKSGILCVEHRSADRCYQNSGEVVDEFLSILAQHKR